MKSKTYRNQIIGFHCNKYHYYNKACGIIQDFFQNMFNNGDISLNLSDTCDSSDGIVLNKISSRQRSHTNPGKQTVINP